MTGSPKRQWVIWAVLATVLALQCGLVLSQVGRKTTQPHDVPVAVQGQVVVAQAVADRLNSLPGDPVRAVVLRRSRRPWRPSAPATPSPPSWWT